MRYIIYIAGKMFERASSLKEAIDKAKRDKTIYNEEVKVLDTFSSEYITF